MENQFNVSLWGDEAFSAILSMKSVPEILSIIARDTSPPLYNLTEHFAFKLFGTSETVIRGLSFFYYLIAVFFVYKIASLIWDKKSGFLTALLSFFNPFFFIYAFEGRMYAILAAGVIASMYFFLKKNWVGYVLATLVALYSHHFSIFALFIQGMIFLVYLARKKQRKTALRIFLSFIVIGILYIPWIIPLYNQTKMVSQGFWLGTPTLVDLRNLIYKFLTRGIQGQYEFSSLINQYSLYIVFAVLLLRKWKSKVFSSIFMILWFLGPIFLTWLLSQKFQSVFYDRYLLYTIPAAMIILATSTRRVSFLLITTILLPMFIYTDFNYFTNPTKKPFKQLASFVLETKKGDDFLINWNSSSHHLWETKYYKIPSPIYIPDRETTSDLPFFVGTALMTDEDIIGKIPQKTPDGYTIQRIGVVTSGSVDEVSVAGYTKGEVFNFGDLKFIWLIKQSLNTPIRR